MRNRLVSMSVDIVWAWRSTVGRAGAVAGMTLVLGSGAGLGIVLFCLVAPILFRAPAYPDAGRLAVLRVVDATSADGTGVQRPLTFAALAERDDLFSAVAGYRRASPVRVMQNGGATSLSVAEVTPEFFAMFGVTGAPSEWYDTSFGGNRPLVARPEAARRVFGETPIVGSTVGEYGGGRLLLGGLLPPSFVFPTNSTMLTVDGVVPPATSFDERTSDVRDWTVIVRLREGVFPEAAAAALSAPDAGRQQVTATQLRQFLTARHRPLAIGALVLAVLIFVLAVGNFASALASQTLYRRPEIAVRIALGARFGDVVRPLSLEVAFVALAATLAAALFARGVVPAVRRAVPIEYQVLGGPLVDGHAILVALLMGGTIVLLGILEVSWIVWRAFGSGDISRPSGVTATAWIRRSGLALQGGIALFLLLSASLVVRSFITLMGQDTGFTGHVVVATVSYPDDYAGVRLADDVHETLNRIRRDPAVAAAGAAKGSFLDRSLTFGGVVVGGQLVPAAVKEVTPGFLEAVGGRVVAGRSFSDRDRGTAIVDRGFAARYFGGSGVGERVGGNHQMEIVGVVAEMQDFALDRRPEPTVLKLFTEPGGCRPDCNRVHYAIRLAAPVDLPVTVVRSIQEVNSAAVVVETTSVGDRLMASVADRRFAAIIVVLFASTALVVCFTGLVATARSTFDRRIRELAVRRAIGAPRRNLVQLITGEALMATSAGMLGATVLWYWAATALTRLSYGVSGTEASTMAFAYAGMTGIVTLTGLFSALRATRLEPSLVLREQ